MKNFEILSTPNTPSVNFNADVGILNIEGRSIPENPGDFYDVMVDWLERYFNNPAPLTIFEVKLEYVNSGSSKYLLSVFSVLKDAYSNNKDVKIRWHFEEDDEAIESLGEHYKSIVGVPFDLVEFV